ncbi:MAG: phosphohistidine phosphatase SixA [Pseudomonadales bacterium]|nr:phosphohistidine phosphatase SixA [Pseudomonadales bacterium]
MNLYLLRHGEAETHAASDALRKLTSCGSQHVIQVGKCFAAKACRIDRCFVSPYLRAQQTACFFLAQQPARLEFETQEILTPEVRAAEVIEFLASVPDENILLISHNPLLSELNAQLTEGNIENMTILGTSELVALSLAIPAKAMATRRFSLSPEAHARQASGR